MDLRGKIAVVTGASSGLGSEFAQHLVRRGSTVYGLARRVDRLKLLKSQLGTNFKPVECDVTDETQ